jgi:polysaccharide deacetylase family protein (PEP-CTERM system associated)
MTSRDITFTFDFEDPRPNNSLAPRHIDSTYEVLDLLSELNVKGTFFCVGEVAKTCGELIKKIDADGHEIALHSLKHVPVTELSPQQFHAETSKGKMILEDITGRVVLGYRAPIFSLTRETIWATDILYDIGFSYSSSVLPAKNPLYGYYGAPRQPFRWASGLLELPAPITKVGMVQVPYLGGIYFRYLPTMYINRVIRNSTNTDGLWYYCHPYDFDHKQSFYKMKNTSLLVSLALWMNRKKSLSKLKKLYSATSDCRILSSSFESQINEGKFDNVAIFDKGK